MPQEGAKCWPEPPARGFPPRAQSRETIREWDRRAIEEYGIAGLVLMENAGRGAASIILGLLSSQRDEIVEPVHVVCGPGNNGGDGFVVARYLHGAGLDVRVYVLAGARYLPASDAGANLAILRRLGLCPTEIAPGSTSLIQSGTCVDGLFGTGLSRPLEQEHRQLVGALNRVGGTIALDIPSGLDADTGEILGEAVRASHTITFAAPKLGFARAHGPELCGRVHVVDIGLPRALWA